MCLSVPTPLTKHFHIGTCCMRQPESLPVGSRVYDFLFPERREMYSLTVDSVSPALCILTLSLRNSVSGSLAHRILWPGWCPLSSVSPQNSELQHGASLSRGSLPFVWDSKQERVISTCGETIHRRSAVGEPPLKQKRCFIVSTFTVPFFLSLKLNSSAVRWVLQSLQRLLWACSVPQTFCRRASWVRI